MKKTKLNCSQGNSQCGGKCQQSTNKCPSEKGLEASVATNKFTKLIAEIPTPSPKDLNVLYKDYEKLIGAESKKQARTKIKGLPSERELKKELLRAEEKAWVFVRLMREKKRLSKKGEEVGELDELLQKIADGDLEAVTKAVADLDFKIAEKRKTKIETELPAKIEEALDVIVSEKTAEKLGEKIIDEEKYREFFKAKRSEFKTKNLHLIDESLVKMDEIQDEIEKMTETAIAVRENGGLSSMSSATLRLAEELKK